MRRMGRSPNELWNELRREFKEQATSRGFEVRSPQPGAIVEITYDKHLLTVLFDPKQHSVRCELPFHSARHRDRPNIVSVVLDPEEDPSFQVDDEQVTAAQAAASVLSTFARQTSDE